MVDWIGKNVNWVLRMVPNWSWVLIIILQTLGCLSLKSVVMSAALVMILSWAIHWIHWIINCLGALMGLIGDLSLGILRKVVGIEWNLSVTLWASAVSRNWVDDGKVI